jgi:hypothetical protein
MHITRYIHLNHENYRTWPHSSYDDYLGSVHAWIDARPILELFSSRASYEEFVADYEDVRRERGEIAHDLFGKST